MSIIDNSFIKTMIAAAAGTVLAAYITKKFNL
jgi:hypothetical protein